MRRLTIFLLLGLLFQGLLLAGCAKPRPGADFVAVSGDDDAQELKLKIRELADQLLASTPNEGISNLVALPTSFVDMDHKNQTSALGNLCAESLVYEFNQRGYPVCEYRLTGNVDMLLGQGDFALLRQGVMRTTGKKWAALIVGTYVVAGDSVFVNGRLVRASDGMVLRTGQVLLPNNALVASLLTPVIQGPSMYAGKKAGKGGSTRGTRQQAARTSPTGAGTATASADKPDANAGAAKGGTGLSEGSMRIVPAPWAAGTPPYKKRRGPRLYGSPIHY